MEQEKDTIHHLEEEVHELENKECKECEKLRFDLKYKTQKLEKFHNTIHELKEQINLLQKQCEDLEKRVNDEQIEKHKQEEKLIAKGK